MFEFHRFLGRVIPFPKTYLITLILICCASVFSGVVYGNTGALLYVGGIGGLFGFIGALVLLGNYHQGISKETALEVLRDFPTVCQMLAFCATPVTLCVALSACLFVDGDMGTDKGKVWVINGKGLQYRNNPFAIPFLHDIKKVRIARFEYTTVLGTTKDGTVVQALVLGNLIPASGLEQFQDLMRRLPNPEVQISNETQRAIQERFQKNAPSFTEDDLSGSVFELAGEELYALGIPWRGRLIVKKLKAYKELAAM